jgi:methyl-accepting chemotaxis protein
MNLFEQEQTINQIASNAKGVSQTVKDFAKSLEEVNKTAAITAHFAALGRTSLTEMETIMQEMKDASTNIVGTLSSLQEKVTTINDVINTIIKIADQINLLALNTAIRASKKGLKGLGFSVVAEKIRELADQTAYAALDIEQMVQNIIEAVKEAAKEVDKFSEQIQEQVKKAMGVREGLIKLISRTQDQVSAFEKVNKGMQEQTHRAAQIHESINQLTNAAQMTTKSVRNLYLEIEYIYHATNSLQEMTKNFTKHSSQKKPGNPPIATVATSQPVNIPDFKEIKDAG